MLLHDRIMAEESAVFGLVRRHCEAAVASADARAAALLQGALADLPRSEHVSLRCSDGNPVLVWGLQETGWRLVDTSIDYAFRSIPEAVPSPWSFGRPRPGERKELAALMGRLLGDTMFIRTRFTTDPQLAAGARDLYAAWALRGLSPGPGKLALVARSAAGAAVGVMTAHLAQTQGLPPEARIELNAVVPEARSCGVYTALLAQTLRDLFAAGAAVVRVRTSGGTVSVQRVWQRLGGVPLRADAVFHRPAEVKVAARRAGGKVSR